MSKLFVLIRRVFFLLEYYIFSCSTIEFIVTYSLYQDRYQHLVGCDMGPNCLFLDRRVVYLAWILKLNVGTI